MRNAAAALIALPGTLFAHPGHGAPESHVHGWGFEHVLLLAMVGALLAIALRKN